MLLNEIALLLLGLVGHAAIWIGVINRLHGVAFPRVVVRWVTLFLLIGLATLPLAWAALLFIDDLPWFTPTSWGRLPSAARWYGYASLVMGCLMVVRWIWRSLPGKASRLCQVGARRREYPARQLDRHPVANPFRRALTRFPGNQCLELEVVEKSLVVPRLPPALDGLVIAHLTDLHFTGTIDRAYFQEIVRLTNAMGADLIAVTGDLVDKAHCIDWIPDTLGQLTAPYGVYAILGNHDLRVKHEFGRLRTTLSAAGLVDLGAAWRHVDLAGTKVLMAGNELPWIRPPATMPALPEPRTANEKFRLLLSHTPDQLGWARRQGFDLMLSGHTHGGQIRVPGVGALLCPSLHGVKYASGVFHEPPTVLHVCRGLSGLDPVRFFCAPELVRLVLRSPQARQADTAAAGRAGNWNAAETTAADQPIPVSMRN